MSATLYLLRQQPERIDPSLFRDTDTDIDIVFVERATIIGSSSVKGVVLSSDGMIPLDSRQTVTYDDLVEKIFSSAHVIVI